MSTAGADRYRKNYIVLSQGVENSTPKTEKEWKKAPGICPLLFLHFHSLLSETIPVTVKAAGN